MPKKTNQIVKESNAIARAKIKPKTESVWEERIIAFLLAKIRIEDEAFHEQVMSAQDLNEGRPLSTREYAEVSKVIEDLADKKYVMPQGWRGMMIYPIFQRLGIDDKGNIQAKLNSGLCEHYLKLREQFAERKLPEFLTLSGTYAQQLFRLLNSWKARGEVEISIAELHDFLSVPESFRKDFKSFRVYVLERARREITEKTSLAFTWEPIRKGLRKVEAVHFTFGVKAIAPEVRKAEATPKKKGRPGKVNRERDGWSREELPKIQRLTEECFHETEDGARKCVPQKKSEVCLYCTTRGRMWSKTYLESMQGRLPFNEA